MNRLSSLLVLTLGLTGSVARADPATSAARSSEPPTAPVSQTTEGNQERITSGNDSLRRRSDASQAAEGIQEPPPLRAEADGSDPDIPLEPRGELVRLARQPEAELLVDVLLTTNDQRSYFEVASESTGASLLVCGSPCRFRIWPGRYRLITNASTQYIGGINQLVIESDAHVSVKQPSVYRSIIGATIGGIGVVGVLTGVVLLASHQCGEACSRTESKGNQYGFAVLSAGVVLAPLGWVLFGQGRSPEVEVTPTRGQYEQ